MTDVFISLPYWRQCLLSQPQIGNHPICSWVNAENWNALNSKVLILRRMLNESHSHCMQHIFKYILWSSMLLIETYVWPVSDIVAVGTLGIWYFYIHDFMILLRLPGSSNVSNRRPLRGSTSPSTWWKNSDQVMGKQLSRPYSKTFNFWHWDISP